MDFSGAVKLFAQFPGAAVAVAEAGAVIYLFKELMRAHAAGLETALKVAPIAEKLAMGVDALERLLARASEK